MRSPALRPPLAVALLLFLGVVSTVLAQPPRPYWPLALGMLAPLVAFSEGRGARAAFGFAYVYSVAMALVVVRWLLHALSVEYGVPAAAGWTFAALLVGAYAIIPATAAAAYTALRPRVGPAAAPILFAALWTFGEWLRAEPLGLPWVLAAHPFAFVPLAIQTAELGGVFAPGFGVALVGAGIGVAAARPGRAGAAALLAPALFVAVAAGWGALRLASFVGAPSAPTGLDVAVVQASVPQRERFEPGSALRNTLHHEALTRRLLAERSADVVVWSETAIDEDLDAVPALERRLHRLVDETGVPLVTGAPRAAGGARRNSVLLFTPGNDAFSVYDKQRLVPFSESEPPALRWLEPLLAPLVVGDPYVPGLGPTLLRLPGAAIAAPVCFEISYPDLLREFDAAGAELVLNLSNDAWFGRTGFAETHLAHAPFRAVELRRWLVRATNTGISAFVDPAGRIVSRLGLFEEGVLRGRVEPRRARTFHARFGDAPWLAFMALCAAGALLQGAGRRPRS